MIQLREAARMVLRRMSFARKGFFPYSGSAAEICKQIVERCWTGQYYKTSTGHFSGFYTRDFGMCVPALIELGYRDRVLQTLAWALDCFEKNGRITTTITAQGDVFDFPTIAPDSLAFLMHALAQAKAQDLIQKHTIFLKKEINRYYAHCVAPSGLPKPLHFSSIKDHAIRKQSCYDTVMFGWLAQLLKKEDLDNPFAVHDYQKLLDTYYWAGDYFVDDLSGRNAVSSDANIFPFWCGVATDKTKCRQALKSIQQECLDVPFPLKYAGYGVAHNWIPTARFAPNYEGTTVWAHLGLIYLDVLRHVDKKQFKIHLEQYTCLTEKHKTFLEVYHPDGSPYKTLFYVADEGMLWASMYLHLMRFMHS